MADRVWAPTRGYFEIGAGGSGGASEPAAEPVEATETAAVADDSGGSPSSGVGSAAEAEAPAETEKKPAAAKKPAEAKKPAAAKPAAAKAPEKDPQRDSVTTVPTLTGSPVGQTVGEQVFDDPDSETTLYRVPSLNVAFFVMSAVLLVYLLLVMWDDYARPWKSIQADWDDELVARYESDLEDARANELAVVERLRGSLDAIVDSIDPENAEALKKRALQPGDPVASFKKLLAQAERALASSTPEIEQLGEARQLAHTELSLRETALRVFRGKFQAARFTYEERKRSVLEHTGDTIEGKRRVAVIDQEFADKYIQPLEALGLEVEDLAVKSASADEAYENYVRQKAVHDGKMLADLQTELSSMSFRTDQLSGNIGLIETNWKNIVRNLPMLDFMAPSFKIQKIVTDDLHEDLQLLTMPRVDRCKTCHINIDDPTPLVVDFESKKWGTVYQSHPRLDLFVGSASPHPYLEFGCTVCHMGDGHSTDFATASHTPNSDEQRAEWERKYHWHEMHHQDWPMLEKRYVTSSCGKCHKEQHNLEGGKTWSLGYEIVETYGCYGCHKIEQFEGAKKVGPNLSHIVTKTDKNFLYKWIRNPQSFRSSTRMPRFFDLSNTGGEQPQGAVGVRDGEMLMQNRDGTMVTMDFHARNGVESLAIATYLEQTSEPRENIYRLQSQGDPKRGRELFRTTACLGCHSVKAESMTPDVGGTPEALVELLEAARTDLRTAGKQHVELATNARKALDSMVDWMETLSVGNRATELYRRIMTATGKLGEAGVDVGSTEKAATAMINRWVHNTRAPDLSSIGSKIKDPNWLADWLIDPRKHDPGTIMPRIFQRNESSEFEEQDVADIVAYMLTLRNEEFEALPAFKLDDATRGPLRDIVYDYLSRDLGRRRSRQIVEQLPDEDQLSYAGYRLIMRYGCFGCHNGIRDSSFTFDASGTMARTDNGLLDAAQRIGAELNGWGNKLPDRLDFGPWGHQHSGREALPHKSRYAWLDAKLTDTRRFDVYPAEQKVAEDKYEYVTTRRLVQKTPEELLKMPRFPFYDQPEQVDAVVSFIVGLVNDPVQPSMLRTLTGDDKVLEDGSRLIAELNCQGCHRIGAEDQFVPYDELPNFSLYDATDEAARVNEMEKETWLTREVEFLGRAAEYDEAYFAATGKERPPSGLRLDPGALIGAQVYDLTTMSMENDVDSDDESLSVVELARRDATVRSIPPSSQVLPVAGYQEGGIRYYFGTNAQQRPQAPPPLVRQGERVRSDWLFEFLLHVTPIRPWLKVRMPSFYLTQEESRTLVRWFKVRSGLPSDGELFAADRLDRDAAQLGKTLFGRGQGSLQCSQCHPVGANLPTVPVLEPVDVFDWKEFTFVPPDDSYYVVWRQDGEFSSQDGFADSAAAQAWAKENVPAGADSAVGQPWAKDTWGPDLGLAAERLRPEWLRLWLNNPPDFMPGTKMPNFFGAPDPMVDPAVSSFPSRENREKIRALIQYLVHMELMGIEVSSAK